MTDESLPEVAFAFGLHVGGERLVKYHVAEFRLDFLGPKRSEWFEIWTNKQRRLIARLANERRAESTPLTRIALPA